ncbi:NAD(FAD)-dependent dehydrogenase [Desulfocurvibacter africanus PCS]|uniref:NAD(FAD)-dependent dehydrogenase n=1 Tax=Desulfocurvibacter africanus PCS TaxID=1262666 RepID=M5Q136_DESAF|nr:FAD-dependent oxidoreductase [Desulfocurvibacter africanus]EMG37231.1 NAD(FAD)-dependent dehydrogenase [Desulfocurvibacter africanus PCS]
MSRKLVIIGAVALGPKVACRARRIDPDADIVMLDRDSYISYGGCGIPYYVGGDVADIDGLLSTAYHARRDAAFFENTKRVRALTETEALEIDRAGRRVRVKDLKSGQESWLDYDTLVLATGSTPVIPPIEGRDLPGVMAVANLHQAKWIKESVQRGQVESAVIVGGGAIGLEMAEAFADLWGIKTTVIEMQPHVLPQALGPDMARLVENSFTAAGVSILTGERAARIVGDAENGVQALETASGKRLDCQLVILAVGARPNTELARKAGLAVGRFGGVLVDRRMRTSDPNIFAGGDCVELPHALSGNTVHMPLGSMANRQGRVIGANVTGSHAEFPPVLGSFCMKAFEAGVARAGLTEAQALDAGYKPASATVAMHDRAHFYPTAKIMYLRLIADRVTRRVLGIEAFGANGDAVKARVDAVAAAMRFGATLEDVSNLEVAYAPPYAQAMDILNAAANVVQNVVEGVNAAMPMEEFLRDFEAGKFKVLDVRGAANAVSYIEKFGDRWLNIPGEELAARLEEIEPEQPLVLFCNSGQRSYEAQRTMASRGLPVARNVEGGHLLLSAMDKEFLGQGEGEE